MCGGFINAVGLKRTLRGKVSISLDEALKRKGKREQEIRKKVRHLLA